MTKLEALSIQNSCDLVLNSVRTSSLNFSVFETPYSIYLSVRKSFSKSKLIPDHILPNCDNQKYANEIEDLKTNLKSAEHANNLLATKYEEAVADSEESFSEIHRLKAVIENCEKIVRDMLKKDKVIGELKTKNSYLESDVSDAEKKKSELNVELKKTKRMLKDSTHAFEKKIQQLENKVKDLTEFKNIKMSEEKEFKIKQKKLEKRENSFEEKEAKLKVEENSIRQEKNQINTSDVPSKVTKDELKSQQGLITAPWYPTTLSERSRTFHPQSPTIYH